MYIGNEGYFASHYYNQLAENYYQPPVSLNEASIPVVPIISEQKQDPKANLRRELTDREKVELEMKKWQKEQKKVTKFH
jgi:hypothetical protein